MSERRFSVGVQLPPFEGLAAMSGRYRLSRRDEQQALWETRVSLGVVGRQEQAKRTALATVACPIKG